MLTNQVRLLFNNVTELSGEPEKCLHCLKHLDLTTITLLAQMTTQLPN